MGNNVAKTAGKICSSDNHQGEGRSHKTSRSQSTRWSAINQHRVARSDYGEFHRITTMDLPQVYRNFLKIFLKIQELSFLHFQNSVGISMIRGKPGS